MAMITPTGTSSTRVIGGSTFSRPFAPPGGGPPPEQGPVPPDATRPPVVATPPPTSGGGLWGSGPRPSQGRIKMGPNGPYWDASDTGPDQWSEGQSKTPAPPAAPGAQPGTYPGTGVFDDPATKHFEELLNQRITQLQTPYQNPDFQPAVDQLRKYLGQLNGPAYTNPEMDLMQTQALDPLERQRSEAKQQVIQRLAAHGIPPSSGIVERALEDVNRSFDQLRTQTQSGFANRAIGQSQQNRASAAAIAPQIATLQQQNFQGQDARNQAATTMAEIIPNLAWSRLQGANAQISPFNSPQLLALMKQFQAQGYDENSAWMQALFHILTQSGLLR